MMAHRACRAAALLLLSAPRLLPSQGIRSTDRGPSVGLGATVVALSTTESRRTTTEIGIGVAAEVGYGFGKRWLGGRYSSATMHPYDGGTETYGLTEFGVAGRYTFRGNDKTARPYLEIAALRLQITADVIDRGTSTAIKSSGLGAGYGGGVLVFFSPRFALDVGFQDGFGTFSDWKGNGVAIIAPDPVAMTFGWRLGGRLLLSGK